MTDYTIKSGDTLRNIAANNGVTVKELQKLNRIKDPNNIQAGAVLILPESTKVDIAKFDSSAQTNGKLSDKTEIANANMKNLKIGFDKLLENLDSFDLPEGMTKEKFKELVEGGYYYHLQNNDLPKTETSPADFVADLLFNASNEFDNPNIKDTEIVKFAAQLFPESTIGPVKCDKINEENFELIRDVENGTYDFNWER